MSETKTRSGFVPAALPFWVSLGLIPVTFLAAWLGGWALALPPLAAWGLFSALDAALGQETRDADAEADRRALFWHDMLLRIWVPLQIFAQFFLLWFATSTGHLVAWEMAGLSFGVGILSGTVGIVYAHELIHRPGRMDRRLGDLLLASVLYGHFRSEHMLVHHVHVGTPRDAVTARYGEGFWRYFVRVLPASLTSAWHVEVARLARKGRWAWDLRNPFWSYAVLQAAFLLLAWIIAGWVGMLLFCFQALVAVWQLELVNYIEHYGLTRQRLPSGRYEPVQPHHSWNAAHKASNWLLINLQRHSDHHAAPMRPFPLLQNHDADHAPQLPHGYPVMTLMAMVPPLWRRRMNPRVAAWRQRHYPGTLAA